MHKHFRTLCETFIAVPDVSRRSGHKAVHWAQRSSTFGGKPVVLVPGNHEFYGHVMPAELARMKEAAAGSNVHLLDRGGVVVDGVRFLGCTLWTDFQLPVRQPSGRLEVDVGRALLEANRCMNDFRLIEVLSPSKNRHRLPEPVRLLQASDTLAMHWTDRDWLRRQLAQPFGGLTVVVTHHAPSIGSVAERYAADGLTPAFVSDLPDEFFAVPSLWVHPHGFAALDALARSMRVVRAFHGHHHDDRSALYLPGRQQRGFDARAVDYYGIKNGLGEVILAGEAGW